MKDVAAHLMAAEEGAVSEFLVAWVRSGFSFDQWANVADVPPPAPAGRSPSSTALMREHAESRYTPPTMDWHAPLTDVMVHREDIAVPLGQPSDRPAESWRHVARLPGHAEGAGAGSACAGCPTYDSWPSDLDWAHGSGPEVTGPAAALALTISGRAGRADRPERAGTGISGDLGRLDPVEWQHNSRGADRFRLGTLVPGEAGRGASDIS